MSDDQMAAPSDARTDVRFDASAQRGSGPPADQGDLPVRNRTPKVTRPWWRLWRRKIEWPPAPNPADYPDMKSYVASIRPVGYLPGTVDEHMTPEQVARLHAVAGRKITWYNSNYWDIYYNTPDHLWMGPWRIMSGGRRVKA